MRNRFCIPVGKAAENRVKLDKARNELKEYQPKLDEALVLLEQASTRTEKMANEVMELMGL
jgi:hypothetical protein